jgi:hypothetical protein
MRTRSDLFKVHFFSLTFCWLSLNWGVPSKLRTCITSTFISSGYFIVTMSWRWRQ